MSRIYLLATCLWAGSVGCVVATPTFMEDREPKEEAAAEPEETKAPAEGSEAIAANDEALLDVSNAGFSLDEGDKLECYYRRPVGSNLIRRACDSKNLREQRRVRDMRELERIRLRP